MTQLVWNPIGERTFEAGVDHGVLYVDGSDGVAWNGLIAVTERPSGGDVKSYFIDGINYMNRSSHERFEATIEAYTYPDEFMACDGTVGIANGLFAMQQKKTSFGLCYRTAIGNDVDGVSHGFKLHLVYGATAAPSDRSNKSFADSIDPNNFSWKIVAKPPRVAGIKPTSKYVIDSRDTPADLLATIMDILYGTATTAPRLPSLAELVFIFTEYQSSAFDAGTLTEDYFAAFDAGHVGDAYTSTIDGGTV